MSIRHVAIATLAISIPVASVAAGAATGTVTAAAATVQGKAVAARSAGGERPAVTQRSAYLSFDQRAATYVKSLQGVPYRYGGASRSGFDCSGLTQYVYAHTGKSISRTAQAQFRQFRRIGKSQAWGGDLVFFHDNSNPSSPVYHVGVYEGGNSMVAASPDAGRVTWESFTWAGNTVTFGTITH
jgi:cell wall-associated NlpC family hydrolase